MNKIRFLAGAAVFAASFSGVSSDAAAAVTVMGTMQEDQEMKNAAADAKEIERIEKESVGQNTAATKAATKDARIKAWEAKRPDERKIEEEAQIADGKIIVDIVIEGAGTTTMATARAAIVQRVGDAYDAKKAQSDRSAIFDTGYFYDLYPSWQYVPEGIVLVYHVLENPVLRSITIEGNTVETTQDLEKLVTVQLGQVMNSRELQKNVAAMQEKYREDGFILAKIEDMNIDSSGDLRLKVNEGRLEGFAIQGNTKTKDRVILREMRLKIGEPFDVKKARRSMQRIYNLGFFEDVNMKLNPGEAPGSVILEADVVEKRTGNFGIGAGYSSSDGFVGMINVGDTNFRGMGDAISLLYEISGDDRDAHGFVFSYRRPWLDRQETTGALRIYNRVYEYDDYDTDGNLQEAYMRKYVGGEITLGRPVNEYTTNFITLRSRRDTYETHKSSGKYGDRGTPAWKAWRDANFGTTRSITFQHVSDTRDNIYNSTSGGRMSLELELAGFGGDFRYQKFTAEDRHFLKIGKTQTVALRGQFGFARGTISESNLYKLGGQDSLRGYRDDQFRGTRLLLLSAEYRFPLISKVQGAFFTDWGNAWSDKRLPNTIKGSIGVGLQIETPVGPIRLDYGRGSDGGRIHFTVGSSF